MIVPALVGTLALMGLAGRWYRRSLAGSIQSRFARDADGVIRGAEPVFRDGSNGAGVLLIHGGGDTPQTMHHLIDAFADRGYSVSAPLLPGHGRDLDAFDSHDADAWYKAVREAFDRLHENHEWVGVVGLSMGGALSARLAAETKQVNALVLASPYLSMPALARLVAQAAPLWGPVVPAIRTASDRSVFDPAARASSLGYGAFTYRSLRSLRLTAARGFAALPRIVAPTLVIQSTTDNRISGASTKLAFDRIGASEKRLEWVEGAGHVITVDYGWERVVQYSVDWIESHRTQKRTGHRRGAPAIRGR